jgi:hypothetical protein
MAIKSRSCGERIGSTCLMLGQKSKKPNSTEERASFLFFSFHLFTIKEVK